ncbi:MAG TPA: aminotransferase class I/II-fold pyridoxal phosphate-dependent enzyme [Vicinamibacterales bacterium]|jgi:dTDP-4-amino-4,6-dideoxygalactose transaminase|nr:aminotransferase class I/II-fold pyridoxal phosphate-dependent enzyme [Vicinamibacterales bacterium]
MAISRYGIRVPPRADAIFEEYAASGRLIQGRDIEQLERAFEARHRSGTAIATSYGRTAFYHILKALDLPPGSEIVLPALTFWVMPEIARVAGLTPVFADVDPHTFTLDPASLERVITPRTRAVVPTHLYGLPCDMNPILAIARQRHLAVIEDCAHALGATYRGAPVGTLGDAAIFSFQTLKPLNAFGGGLALVKDGPVARRVRDAVDTLPWPDETRVRNRFKVGRAQRFFTKPSVFSLSGFPILWLCSWFDWSPDVYLWETIRPLDPFPSSYLERFPNAQAAMALAALPMLDEWTELTRAHAHAMDVALAGIDNVQPPFVPEGRTHVYYQYCAYVSDRDRVVCECIRDGVDIESLHVDVCTELPLFAGAGGDATPGAARAAAVIQIPVYASLTKTQLGRVARTVRNVATR